MNQPNVFLVTQKINSNTIQSHFTISYTDEPFVWAKLHGENVGRENVYFKSQTPYNYTEAKEYCNRQGDLKSTGVGTSTHASQLWNFNNTTKTLKNKIWTSDPGVTWNIIEKGKDANGNNLVSIQKITEDTIAVLRSVCS